MSSALHKGILPFFIISGVVSQICSLFVILVATFDEFRTFLSKCHRLYFLLYFLSPGTQLNIPSLSLILVYTSIARLVYPIFSLPVGSTFYMPSPYGSWYSSKHVTNRRWLSHFICSFVLLRGIDQC